MEFYHNCDFKSYIKRLNENYNKREKELLYQCTEVDSILAKELQEVDLVINTMSMQHMTERNLHYYFEQIERLSPDNSSCF